MKNYLFIAISLLLALFSVNALAYTPPPAPADGWYVLDKTGKLSNYQKEKLNFKIDKIRATTKNEFAILLIPNMEGSNIEDVAYSTYNAWGVGKKGLDNGCLIVVSLKERKSRIETGKGTGGEVTDLQSHDILQKNLGPHLKKGEFYEGFDETLDALSALMESKIKESKPASTVPVPVSNPSASAPSKPTGCDINGVGFQYTQMWTAVGIFVSAIFLIAYLMRRSEKRRQAETERLNALRRKAEKEARIRADQARIAKEKLELNKEILKAKALPVIQKKVSSAPTLVYNVPSYTKSVKVKSPIKPIVAASVARVSAAAASAEANRLRTEREVADRKAAADRQKRDQEDADRRRRDESARSPSSSSSFDWGGGGSSGSGFGGGESGGGGSSGDW